MIPMAPRTRLLTGDLTLMGLIQVKLLKVLSQAAHQLGVDPHHLRLENNEL